MVQFASNLFGRTLYDHIDVRIVLVQITRLITFLLLIKCDYFVICCCIYLSIMSDFSHGLSSLSGIAVQCTALVPSKTRRNACSRYAVPQYMRREPILRRNACAVLLYCTVCIWDVPCRAVHTLSAVLVSALPQ